MKRKSAFEKKYPHFVKYIEDESIRANMLVNEDLYQRIQKNEWRIIALLSELDRHFDVETTRDILLSTIFKYPDELLSIFINAYLSSDEATKSNLAIVEYFNKTIHLGEDCLKYIERFGIIANRSYKQLPIICLNYQYESLKKGDEVFKFQKLDELFYELSILAKQFVIKLIKTNNFQVLDKLFTDYNYSFHQLLYILIDNYLDETIINEGVLDNLGAHNLVILIFMQIDSPLPKFNIKNLKRIIELERYSLLNSLMEHNLIRQLYRINEEYLETYQDDIIIEYLRGSAPNLVKRDD